MKKNTILLLAFLVISLMFIISFNCINADEKIAKLDRKGIEQFGEVINIISKWYKRIFIITHLENLKDMFNEGEIFVNKIDNTSIVTVNSWC